MQKACTSALRAPKLTALRALLSAWEGVLLYPARTTAAQEENINTLTSLLQHVTKVAAQTRYFSWKD